MWLPHKRYVHPVAAKRGHVRARGPMRLSRRRCAKAGPFSHAHANVVFMKERPRRPRSRHGCPVEVLARPRRRDSLPQQGGRAGEGGALTSRIVGLCEDLGEVSATPHPNPPPHGGREFSQSLFQGTTIFSTGRPRSQAPPRPSPVSSAPFPSARRFREDKGYAPLFPRGRRRVRFESRRARANVRRAVRSPILRPRR